MRTVGVFAFIDNTHCWIERWIFEANIIMPVMT
jgi:hypothetical protein